MSRNVFVGFDGGQSGSRAVVADAKGRVLGLGEGPACEHITAPTGVERNRDAIHGAVQDALTKAGVVPVDVVAIGLGLTSAPRELNAQPIFEELVREILQPDHIWIDHDAATNLAGASAGAPGTMVIAGSGSIAFGVNESGKEAVAGGLGYLMGDEGSAWWIGIQALQAAAAAADGRGPATALLPLVLDHYNLPTVRHLHTILYADSFRRPMVSGLTVDVARLAASDDAARSIVTEAGQRLANMVLAVVRKIHHPGDEVGVYPTGGVFRAGDVITVPFEQTLGEHWPGIIIRQPQFEPVVGALIRGYQRAGAEVDADLIRNLHDSLESRSIRG